MLVMIERVMNPSAMMNFPLFILRQLACGNPWSEPEQLVCSAHSEGRLLRFLLPSCQGGLRCSTKGTNKLAFGSS